MTPSPEMWTELARTAPTLLISVLLLIVILAYLDKTNQRMIEQFKLLEESRKKWEEDSEERRMAFTRDMNNMLASSMKMLHDAFREMQQTIRTDIRDHDEADQKRYEKLGITNDLYKAMAEKNTGLRK